MSTATYYNPAAPRSAEQPWYKIKAQAGSDSADVLIYDTIGAETTAKDFVTALNALKVGNINLRINSPGGSVFDGLAIYNALRDHPATVTCYIDGMAASIAS